MEEMLPAVIVPLNLGNSICKTPILEETTLFIITGMQQIMAEKINSNEDCNHSHDDGFQESEDEIMSVEGDQIFDSSCTLSMVSDSSSFCGEDLIALERVTSEISTLGSQNGEKNVSVVEDKIVISEKVLSVVGTVARSVFDVDCVPLWGYTSICGRRPEMEDAVATEPRFLKVPIQMLTGDRGVDQMTKSLSHLTTHFFGVYDGHGGFQVSFCY